MSDADRLFLEAAIALAERGRASCAPNPAVGCLITKQGQIIGRGYHVRTGEAHAEVNAIADAGGQVKGATVYISLEPCAFAGRTPACAQTLVEAGVARVVVAAVDPHPNVSGEGLAMLERAGIRTELIDLPAARECIAPYVSRELKGRPSIRIKSASSLDGAIALADGSSQWITGPQARADVQRWRARADAIVTGVGTVLADDPQLNVRDAELGVVQQPLRVVLDRTLRTPRTAQLLNDGAPTLLVHRSGVQHPPWLTALSHVSTSEDPDDIAGLMGHLAQMGCNEILVEAGPAVVGAFLAAGLWDEWVSYVAPKWLGDGAQALANLQVEALADAPQGHVIDTARLGQDIRLRIVPNTV